MVFLNHNEYLFFLALFVYLKKNSCRGGSVTRGSVKKKVAFVTRGVCENDLRDGW